MDDSEPPSNYEEKTGAVKTLKNPQSNLENLSSNGLKTNDVDKELSTEMFLLSLEEETQRITLPPGITLCKYSVGNYCPGVDLDCWHHETEDCKTKGCELYKQFEKQKK